MQYSYKMGKLAAAVLILTLMLLTAGCGNTGTQGNNFQHQDSGDPEYEAQVITIEGLNSQDDTDVSLTEISVKELRQLPQYNLDANYKRTTGLTEEFKMSGPFLKEVIDHLGGNLGDYAGIGVIGRDGYYCLLSKEVIDATPDLMLALNIDGEAKLDDDNAPARLAVQGQFGPYWVKMVEKIILFKEIPEKNIKSVWVFKNLAEGIEPYEYEYYGSKDDAIDLEQIFSRLDYVDSKAFFTMKSSDGFKKNEVINMVKSRYYIKVEGEDAPTNVSPYIKLGMNVHNIAWVSTNQDAAIFPYKMSDYMDTVRINGQEGISLQEVLYETEVAAVRSETFDILGTDGEKITVPGEDMSHGILVPRDDGSAGVVWEESTGHKNINNLLRIRLVEKDLSEKSVSGNKNETITREPKDGEVAGLQPADQKNTSLENEAYTAESKSNDVAQGADVSIGSDSSDAETVLTITGDGVKKELYLSMRDIKGLEAGYLEQCYSMVNNYPTRKFAVSKGIDVAYLFQQIGIKNEAESIQIEASDGYRAQLTRDQLFGERYRYPELLSGSTANPVKVKPMLAWAFGEGQDVSQADECDLRLVIGQQGIHDVNTAPGVQMVSKITVSAKAPGKWSVPTVTVEDGEITLAHDYLDQVKLYYTLDGSEPTVDSLIYNPSTTYFQPDLIKPIPINGPGILKVKVIGYGKKDSEVLTYEF
jgi:DMSO/TMAO reductase YedYZ molybdopterin-dependent catalytic subunit